MSSEDIHSQLFLAQWKQACGDFDISVRVSITPLVSTLEAISQALAGNIAIRTHLGASTHLWIDLRKLWRDLARAQLTFWDGDEDEESEGPDAKENDLRTICGSLAKFTRNLVAGVPENQDRAYENEPDIRRLLHYHTSWSAMENNESIPVARLLAQTLSNMVTANESLISKLWETYMNLPEDQVILIRLLASPDPRTLLTIFVFILNCVYGNRRRCTMLSRTIVGSRICIYLLDDMLKLYDAEESSQGAQAFDVGYDILTQLIEQGLIPDLYVKFTLHDEIVTPHQTTLLKIVDSYLHSVQMNTTSTATHKTVKVHKKLSPMLAKCFFDLSTYAREAVSRALHLPDQHNTPGVQLSTDTPSTPKPGQPLSLAELDVILPKVCEALVLVTQCIVTITLEADNQRKGNLNQNTSPESDLKVYFTETRSSDGGIVQSLIELLRLLDLFLPRINFGKAILSPSVDARTPTQQTATDPTGFQYLKRDLVRLLGILCYGSRAVQDHVRDCGGIQVVMNLCVVDERNPYLREHAIFTLHSLLKDNPENQTIVDAIKPAGEWDENGVLKDIPGSVRK